MTPQYALTVAQPFAWAIITGAKRVENRSWSTRYRGPLLIHAGCSRAWFRDREQCAEDLRGQYDLVDFPAEADLAFGAISGVVDLVDVVPVARARRLLPQARAWIEGPLCWLLEDPRPLRKPFVVRGQLGLWRPPEAAARRLRV